MKAEDSSRPVQYEQAHQTGKTDIFCPMYYDYKNCIKYCEDDSKTKPLIQCEYAHAMGNSEGGFKEYWDLVRKYPKYQGGFIWDFVDQSCRWKGKDGVMIYAYGGDFNRFDASDFNFCDNGLISPDRKPNPHMYEVAYYYQNIWTTPGDLSKGEVKVYNENFFRDLSAYAMEWEVLKDGKAVRSGRMENLNVAPRQTATVKLDLGQTDGEGEWLLNVRYIQKNRENLIPAGHVVAKDQLALTEYKAPSMDFPNVVGSNEVAIVPEVNADNVNCVEITGSNFTLSGLTFTSDNPYPVEFVQIGGDNALVDGNVFFGPDQSGPSTGWVVNRGVVTQNSVSGLRMINNLFYSLRQPAYFNPSSSGNVLYNTVYNTRGFVVDGAFMQFSGNSWGSPANAVDIALLSGTTTGVPYDSVPALEASNSSANVSDQR